MPGNYSVTANLTTPNSGTLAAVFIQGSASIRGRLFDIVVGSTGAPADNAARFTIQRNTAAWTGGTAITPIATDPGFPAAVCTAGHSPTGGGSLTTPALLQWGQNQRATFRWVAAPGAEIISTAAANNGLALMNPTVNASFTMEATLIFSE